MNPVLLPDAEWFDLAYEGANAGADMPEHHGAQGPWRIFLSHPRGAPPAAGWPVVTLLDANAGFATLVETLRRGAARPQATGIEEAVIVGIGYPEGTDIRARRRFDFTAGASAEAGAEARAAPEPSRGVGGRDRFLAFIEHRLKPEIARRLPVDPARQTLFGHSLAGWFTLDVMTRAPHAFTTYVAVSPSIWWDEARLIAGLSGALARAQATPVRLALMVGEWEQALAPWQAARPEAAEMAPRRARRAMVDRTRAFAERAAAALAPAGEVRFERMAGEDHASILAPAMARALRFALAV
jgi:hypothetical protein